MRDLRKKILLESGKTVSKKARARPESNRGSAAGSPAPSRGGSRATSRYASEEEDISDSEYDDSIGSSSVLNSDDGEDNVTASWTDRLQDRITEILDRKRSSAKGRETSLNAYAHLIRYHYAAEQVENHWGELIPALLRSIRGGANYEETVAALKALTLTILSAQSETVYDQVWPSLKGACENSDEESVKVEAIDAMGVATMCGGGSVEAAEDVLDFLLEIVESDGHSVEAPDNGRVVASALTTWGFVASHLEDLQAQSEQALEAFTEQLDSTDVAVQIAAGTNIALIFEAAREYEEGEGEEEADGGKGESGSWNLQYDQHRLVQRMTALVRESSKAVSKKDRKQLHASFNSVLTSLERGKGPGYSTARRQASNPHTGGSRVDFNDAESREYGYRERIRVHNISMLVDSWSLSTRIELLRSVLGGGLAAHYLENPAVRDLLSSAQVQLVSAPKKGGAGDDYTSSPKRNRGPKAGRSVAGL